MEEPGLEKAQPAGNALIPCAACGAPVIVGELADGTGVAVEQETRTYVLAWPQKTARPTLTESRGYPAHTCRRAHG